MDQISHCMVALDRLRAHPKNARAHSRKQIGQIADSIRSFGFTNPVLVDEELNLLAGHGRVQAAKLLGLKEVPAIEIVGLSEAKKRALLLADNKLAEKAGWDRERLALEIPELTDLLSQEELDISITGFEPYEIDQIRLDFEENAADPADFVDEVDDKKPPVSQSGDLWLLGPHRLLCGDARQSPHLAKLMREERAAMAFLDPPYNVRVRDIVGRGRRKHREFAMASGEMSRADFVVFLEKTLGVAAEFSQDGAVHFVCMDWRHIGELVEAGELAYAEMLNLVVWAKSNAGQGSFYRSQHELIGVFRVGDEPHLNNVALGKNGRSRSNVWRYAGVNSFRTGRLDELTIHPTVKPVAMVVDAMKDCTRPKDIVLDTFSGSGSVILAAEKCGRRAYALEIDPTYVDAAIRRWQQFTGKDAHHAESNVVFDEIQAERVREKTPVMESG